MTFHNTASAFDDVRHSTKMTSEFLIEAVAYQQVAIEETERRAFSVRAMHLIKDKRSRLRVAARYIKNGTVKFPRKGCEELINQRLGFWGGKTRRPSGTRWCGSSLALLRRELNSSAFSTCKPIGLRPGIRNDASNFLPGRNRLQTYFSHRC
jgi:hypothetical protein